MKNFEYLQVGDQIRETDEMEHRSQWYPIKEFAIKSGSVLEGMRRIRRRITVRDIPAEREG